MKELTFKEVIANIKADEVWENNKIKITTNSNLDGDFRITLKKEKEGELYLFNYEKFRLQRNKVSFSEAFKAFEEGKEIESCVSGYCFINKHKEYLTVKDVDSHTYFGMDPMFSFEEIQGEWYIN